MWCEQQLEIRPRPSQTYDLEHVTLKRVRPWLRGRHAISYPAFPTRHFFALVLELDVIADCIRQTDKSMFSTVHPWRTWISYCTVRALASKTFAVCSRKKTWKKMSTFLASTTWNDELESSRQDPLVTLPSLNSCSSQTKMLPSGSWKLSVLCRNFCPTRNDPKKQYVYKLFCSDINCGYSCGFAVSLLFLSRITHIVSCEQWLKISEHIEHMLLPLHISRPLNVHNLYRIQYSCDVLFICLVT